MTSYDLLLAAVAAVGGAVAAVSGFGIGSLVTPAVAIGSGTRLAVAIVALPHAVATAFRLWNLRDAVDRRVFWRFGLASAAGGLAGGVLHAVLGGDALTAALGLLLVASGLSALGGARLRLPAGTRWAVTAGSLSGLFGGLVGNQGGIRTAALLHLGLAGRALVATSTATGLVVDGARLPVYLATSGTELMAALPTVTLLTAGALVGTVLGAPILRRLPDRAYRAVVGWLLVALGAWLLVRAAA